MLVAAERLPGGAASCRVMLHAWRRRADPPLLPVRTVRTSRTNNAELRAGTGGAPGRGSGGSRDPRSAGDPDGRKHDCRDLAGTHDCRDPRLWRARDGRTARVRRTPPRCEDEPQPKQLRGRRARRAGPRACNGRGNPRGDAPQLHVTCHQPTINVQLRTAQCTSRSPIQASSPDS